MLLRQSNVQSMYETIFMYRISKYIAIHRERKIYIPNNSIRVPLI